MTHSENGFALLDQAVAIALIAMISLAATMFTFHALHTAAQTDARIAVDSNVQNAGDWISHDAYMADDVITTNLTPPTILILKWTDWSYGSSSTYYSSTYSVDNTIDGIGQLNRRLQSSSGVDQRTQVASHVYFLPDDPSNSTRVTYQVPVINITIVTRLGDASQERTYQICRRPNF